MYLLANLPTSTFQGPRLPTDADSVIDNSYLVLEVKRSN